MQLNECVTAVPEFGISTVSMFIRHSQTRAKFLRLQELDLFQCEDDMDLQEAIKTIRALADGFDPETNHMLPGDSICRKPLSVKALNRAVGALIAEQQREKSRAGNAGKYWTGKEDAEVCEQVRGGMDFHDIAKAHNRSVASIVARLISWARSHRKNPTRIQKRLPEDLLRAYSRYHVVAA